MLRTGSVVMIMAFLCVACDQDLRGSSKPSPDGKAYLVIADDNGGQCGPLTIDGTEWPHKIGEPGAIEPGMHTIRCGTEIQFEIPPGVVFSFDYWGP